MKHFIRFFFTCGSVIELILAKWFYDNHSVGTALTIFGFAMATVMEIQANKIIDAIKKDDD